MDLLHGINRLGVLPGRESESSINPELIQQRHWTLQTDRATEQDLLAELERSPGSTAAALISALRIGSQATFSRLVTGAGDRVVAIGKARARRYAASREIRGIGRSIPVFRVAAAGTVARVAALRPCAPGGYLLEGVADFPRALSGRRGDGWFDALPPMVRDLRPAGFAAAGFARSHPDLPVPDRPADWSDDDTLVALALAGEDGPGDFLLGETSVGRLYAAWSAPQQVVEAKERSRVFPTLAAEAISGVIPGAWVGGAQPKFPALVRTAGAPPSHRLVKFSPSEFSPSARRWCDLLACEHLALETLRAHGIPAAESELVEGGSRVFLQVTRFDRVGERGRRAIVSLAALNDAYLGLPSGAGRWGEAVEKLAEDRRVARADVDAVHVLDAFGRFIANTDMHFGNLSFLERDDGTLGLAPVYDMLPMDYAPIAGDVPLREFAALLPEPGREVAWTRAGAMAVDCWRAVSRDERVSGAFRTIAGDNAAAVVRALDRLGGSIVPR